MKLQPETRAVADLAAAVNLSKLTIKRWLRTGTIPCSLQRTPRGEYLFSPSEFEAALQAIQQHKAQSLWHQRRGLAAGVDAELKRLDDELDAKRKTLADIAVGGAL